MTTDLAVGGPPTPAEEAGAFERDIIRDARRAKVRGTVTMWSLRVAAFVIFLAVWQALPPLGIARKLFVSDPLSVARKTAHLVTLASTWVNVWQTFYAAFFAVVIGSVLGILCGVLFTRLPTLARAMNPYVSLANALPRPALAPLFILWFGLGTVPKVLVGVSIVFFILLLNTMAGLRNVDPDISLLTDSLGATKTQKFFQVELPAAVPSVVAGLRLGAVYAVLGVVVSEIVAAYKGLGTMLVQSTQGFDVVGTFAVLILITLVASVLDIAVRQLERRVAVQSSRSRRSPRPAKPG